MENSHVSTWANALSAADKKKLVQQAVQAYRPSFTNPDDVARCWLRTWEQQGFTACRPFLRDYLARQHTAMQEAVAA